MESNHVCPWWCAYWFDNALRRLVHNPRKIYGPYVGEGMTVADLGCGMGWSAIGLAKLVGETGKVIAVDLQEKMLAVLTRRAARAGVAERIRTVHCKANALGFEERIDFAAAFWMLHETPDAGAFLGQVYARLRDGGKMLVVEPRMHVSKEGFEEAVESAKGVGFGECGRPRIRWSRAVVLVKD